jgi:hypothetical protein
MRNTLYLFGFTILLSACQPDPVSIPNIRIDEAFEPFVESFIQEGEKRGYTIDFSDTGLGITFGNIPNASASCTEIAGHDSGSHQIIINKDAWQILNDSLRERLIFHELGHCELNRVHRNDKFEDGSWKSIMRGDPLNEIEEILPIPYFGFRRAYYIDELFNENQSLPDWANLKFEYDEIAEESKNLLISKQNLSFLQDTIDFTVDDYELEFVLRTLSGEDITWVAWGTAERHYFFWTKGDRFYFAANSAFQGPFHFVQDANLNFQTSQKVTIRQVGPFCKVFLNESFFFMVDRLPADLFFVQSSTENDILIEEYNLHTIE